MSDNNNHGWPWRVGDTLILTGTICPRDSVDGTLYCELCHITRHSAVVKYCNRQGRAIVATVNPARLRSRHRLF